MKVTVLFGGPSAEREVSLVSGRAVIEGLKSAGHDVYGSDISPADLSALDHPCDVVFPVLHGQWGESGELQEILESREFAFVGSGSVASRLGMNKVESKRLWEKAGLPTPSYKVLTRATYDEAEGLESLGITSPCVVKAIDSGSSIDVFICKNAAEAHSGIQSVLAKHAKVLVERFVKGPELTIGLLEEQPLEPIRIVPKVEFFDYEAKYKRSDTEHRFDTGLSATVVKRCQELAREANNILGCRDLARVDLMLDDKNHPFLLEINTLPGFTPKSLLPEAAAHAGIPFAKLVDRLVKRAASRRQAVIPGAAA